MTVPGPEVCMPSLGPPALLGSGVCGGGDGGVVVQVGAVTPRNDLLLVHIIILAAMTTPVERKNTHAVTSL